jgi:hypothetical protein
LSLPAIARCCHGPTVVLPGRGSGASSMEVRCCKGTPCQPGDWSRRRRGCWQRIPLELQKALMDATTTYRRSYKGLRRSCKRRCYEHPPAELRGADADAANTYSRRYNGGRESFIAPTSELQVPPPRMQRRLPPEGRRGCCCKLMVVLLLHRRRGDDAPRRRHDLLGLLGDMVSRGRGFLRRRSGERGLLR